MRRREFISLLGGDYQITKPPEARRKVTNSCTFVTEKGRSLPLPARQVLFLQVRHCDGMPWDDGGVFGAATAIDLVLEGICQSYAIRAIQTVAVVAVPAFTPRNDVRCNLLAVGDKWIPPRPIIAEISAV